MADETITTVMQEVDRIIHPDGVVEYGGFRVPDRRDFVDPLFVEKGGDRESDYAPLVDFLPAPELAEVAQRVIAKYPRRFRHLVPPIDQRVDYLWKRAGGEANGKATLAALRDAVGTIEARLMEEERRDTGEI